MEFVGKTVKKEFEGFGVFEGVVESYDLSTGFFKIIYEDGDSEEADFSEVSRLLSTSVVANSVAGNPKMKQVGRQPKKRRRIDPGKIDTTISQLNNLGQNVVNNCNDSVNVNGNLDLNRELNVDDRVQNGEIRGCIDLNVSVDEDVNDSDAEKVGRIERGFDLNLGINDDCTGGEDVKDGVVDANHRNYRVCDDDVQLEGGNLEATTPDEFQGGRRKKRKVFSSAETVLRRSARRAKAAAVNQNVASSVMVGEEANDLSGVIDEAEKKPVPQALERRLVEPQSPPLEIELPPSSTNLDLEGIPVLDLFSVYACLRSFSTILYLSPFELEDLVAALKNMVSNQLIDLIHVSILQTLRKHLELLASEGCDSASACLRNLNWDLLDAITWPVFMVEYLLIHGSGLKPGFSLSRLKLFDGEYYKKPADVKLELLRCLCDDVVEVEAIRFELSKRTVTAEANMEAGRTTCNERKRRTSSEVPVDSCLNEVMKEEVADGNSDECCLCKMDGNLICCDGCPAAYHSKCVGIVSSLLPEGNWYCPECVIGKLNFADNPHKYIRGAELLGTDVCGRLFFSCFDYLLVSDSCDAEALCSYYHKNDLGAVTQLLQSSRVVYGSILSAISQHWAFSIDLCQPKSDFGGANDGRKTEKIITSRCTGNLGSEFSEPADLFGSNTAQTCIEAKKLLTSSEGSGEVLQEHELIEKSCRPVTNMATRGKSGRKLTAFKQWKKKGSARKGRPVLKAKEEDVIQVHSGDGYLNSYSFARTASSVVEELLKKPSTKVNIDAPKTEEQIISIQLKFILKNSAKSCWTTIQDLNRKKQIEKCGWCYCCRFPVEGRGCLFSVQNGSFVSDALKVEIDGVLSKRNKKGHLVDVICYILCMEERLRGLLSGPWLRPQYSELWRQRVLKASDVSSLKLPLLTLEANLRPLVLSSDWWKHVDVVTTMGSSSHFLASSRSTSKNSISKKKVRCADAETKSSTRGLVLFWWRGGKTSRSLFNWKVIPRSLALKGARNAGCMKIPGIQYPDASETARRTKCVAWRAALERSTSLEQLALQVREFDLFIRWDDIENTHPYSLLDKESIKSIRLFKKVIIRRKCLEGTVARYLLDFGKRRSVPDVVLKHGQKFEKSDCEKKKFWLDEAYVPLYLLKSFEERRITRIAGKKISSKFRRGVKEKKKPSREKGFDYLFSKAERADSYQCGHCNKNVLISEAVSCQLCNGYFHKRHVMKSSEVITSGCIYTCHRCRAGKHVKKESNLGKRKIGKLRDAKNMKVVNEGPSAALRTKPRKKGRNLGNRRHAKKMQSQEQTRLQKNTIVSTGITLRRSARKAKSTILHSNNFAVGNKKKRSMRRIMVSKKTPKVWQKKRTQILYSFWVNGLKLSRKPNDERVMQFKRRKLLVPSDSSAKDDDQPNCSLCSQHGSTSALMCIACEICGDWFHGDAFGLNEGNIECLMGFKCHVCLDKSPPVCPFADNSRDNSVVFIEATRDVRGSPEAVEARKETDYVVELQGNEAASGLLAGQSEKGCDRNLDQIENLMLDSEVSVLNGSSTSREAVSCSMDNSSLSIEASIEARDTQGLPEVVAVEKKTDSVLELQCNEDSSGLLEVYSAQNSDKVLDQGEIPILDSEFSVKNRSPTRKNVASCSDENSALLVEVSSLAQDAQGFPEVLTVKKGADCVLELQCKKGSSDLFKVDTGQNCDGNLDQDDIPMLDSLMRVVNGSPSSKETLSCLKDNNNIFIDASSEVQNTQESSEIVAVRKETGVVELQCNEGSSGLLKVDTAQKCCGNLDQDDTPMIGSELRVENGSATSKEVASCSGKGLAQVVSIRKETDCVLKHQCNESSLGLIDSHTVQGCDRNLHVDETLLVDSELRVVNGSAPCKEAVFHSIESQDVDLEAKLLKESDEINILERELLS